MKATCDWCEIETASVDLDNDVQLCEKCDEDIKELAMMASSEQYEVVNKVVMH